MRQKILKLLKWKIYAIVKDRKGHKRIFKGFYVKDNFQANDKDVFHFSLLSFSVKAKGGGFDDTIRQDIIHSVEANVTEDGIYSENKRNGFSTFCPNFFEDGPTYVIFCLKVCI